MPVHSSEGGNPRPVATKQPQLVTIREQIQLKKEVIEEGTSWKKLPRIEIQGKQYIADAWLQTMTSSGILEHGDYLTPIKKEIKDGIPGEKKGIKVWLCHHCDSKGQIKIFDAATLNDAKSHLESPMGIGHGLVVGAHEDALDGSNPQAAVSKHGTIKQEYQGPEEIYKNLFVKLIVKRGVPLEAYTLGALKESARAFREGRVRKLLPDLVPIIGSWLLEAFDAAKATVKRQLKVEARSKINISFHTMEFPHKDMNMIAVAAHFVDQDWKLRTRLIGLRRIVAVCSPETIVHHHLINVIDEYGIHDRLGLFTADGDATNKQVLYLLIQHYSPSLTKSMATDLVNRLYVRSYDQILDTIATNFIYKMRDRESSGTIGITCIEKSYRMNSFILGTPQREDNFRRGRDMLDDLELPREIVLEKLDEYLGGYPAGSIESPITYKIRWPVLSSTRRAWAIDEVVPEGDIVGSLKGSTWWNNILKGVEAMLVLECTMKNFLDNYQSQIPPTYKIFEDEFDYINSVRIILRDLNTLTIVEANETMDLPLVLALLKQVKNCLSTHAERYLNQNTDSQPLAPAQKGQEQKETTDKRYEVSPSQSSQQVNPQADNAEYLVQQGRQEINDACRRAIRVADDYLKLFDKSPAYWAAIVLHPQKGFKGIAAHDSELAKEVKEKVMAYWKSEYAKSSPRNNANTAAAAVPSWKKCSGGEPSGSLFDSPESDDENEDELTRYLRMEKTGYNRAESNPLLWWRDRQKEFPLLRQFALDILSVPATSIECKRILKQSETTVLQSHRARPDIVEAILCLKQWDGDSAEDENEEEDDSEDGDYEGDDAEEDQEDEEGEDGEEEYDEEDYDEEEEADEEGDGEDGDEMMED